MSQDALKYLQQDDIGKVIAKGLASLYSKRPQKPIKYLAEWLKSFSQKKKQLSGIVEIQKEKSKNIKIFQETEKIKQLQKQEIVRNENRRNEQIKQFENMVAKHQYQLELLEETLPEFIEQFSDITGAYVGQLNYPPKKISEEDVEENAHLNTATDKVINYIGSSLSHKDLMRGRQLKLNEGVTGKVFSLQQKQEPPVVEQGQEQPKQDLGKQQEKYIYIPNVVKNQSVHYFKIPKLGAYLAVPLIYKSYLKEKIFDEVLDEKKKQLNQHAQFEKKKKQEIEQLHKNKEEAQKKAQDLREKKPDEAQLEALANQIIDLTKKIEQRDTEKYEVQPITPNFITNSFVICADNLGKDKQLDPKDINLIVQLANHFKVSWENKEKQLLFKDIHTQIDFLNSLGNNPQNIKQQLEAGSQPDQESMKEIQQIEDEFLRNYKLQEETYKRLKEAIQKNELYINSWLKLKDFRVIKYKGVIQNILYFLGNTKQKINIPNQANLNCKIAKHDYITKQSFDNILNYVVHGPKQKQFKFYAKTQALLKQFQTFNQEDIFGYNVGLGSLVKFIKLALKHRINNVKLRKLQKEQERAKRENLIEQNNKIDLQRQQQLKQHKDKLLPDQVEGFKEEDWITKFDKQNPKHQVPPEVVDDIDNDII